MHIPRVTWWSTLPNRKLPIGKLPARSATFMVATAVMINSQASYKQCPYICVCNLIQLLEKSMNMMTLPTVICCWLSTSECSLASHLSGEEGASLSFVLTLACSSSVNLISCTNDKASVTLGGPFYGSTTIPLFSSEVQMHDWKRMLCSPSAATKMVTWLANLHLWPS